MRALSLPSLVLLLAFAGCGNSDVGPQLPEGGLNGNWETPDVATRAGKSLALTSSEGQVAGTGQDFDDQHQVIGSYTVVGTYLNADITLAMSYADNSSATFDGRFVDTLTVQGTWTGPNGGQITLVRVN